MSMTVNSRDRLRTHKLHRARTVKEETARLKAEVKLAKEKTRIERQMAVARLEGLQSEYFTELNGRMQDEQNRLRRMQVKSNEGHSARQVSSSFSIDRMKALSSSLTRNRANSQLDMKKLSLKAEILYTHANSQSSCELLKENCKDRCQRLDSETDFDEFHSSKGPLYFKVKSQTTSDCLLGGCKTEDLDRKSAHSPCAMLTKEGKELYGTKAFVRKSYDARTSIKPPFDRESAHVNKSSLTRPICEALSRRIADKSKSQDTMKRYYLERVKPDFIPKLSDRKRIELEIRMDKLGGTRRRQGFYLVKLEKIAELSLRSKSCAGVK
jgi:hypothetical protein